MLIINYHLFCFTDFVLDVETRSAVGSSINGFTCLNVICNMGYVAFAVGRQLLKDYRKKSYDAKVKKHHEMKQKELLRMIVLGGSGINEHLEQQ